MGELGSFDKVLEKLQKDLGEELWKKISEEYQRIEKEMADGTFKAPTGGSTSGAGGMDCSFLDSITKMDGDGKPVTSLTMGELTKMCESIGIKFEDISKIGEAAEKLAEELGSFDKVLEKLQKDLGEELWKKISEEYQRIEKEMADGTFKAPTGGS